MIKKTCSGDWRCCSYARFGSGAYVNCSFTGYCNFQLPNNQEIHLIHDGIEEAKHSKGVPFEDIRKEPEE